MNSGQVNMEKAEVNSHVVGDDLVEVFHKWTMVYWVQMAAGKDLNKLNETVRNAIARVQELQEGWLIKHKP